MSFRSLRGLLRYLWLTALLLLLAVWLFPVSYPWTKAFGLAAVAGIVAGVLVSLQRHRFAQRVVAVSVLFMIGVLFLPGRKSSRSVAELRRDYVSGLERYEGVPYVWGGESPLGIDCSGLVRRGLIDAMFLRGLSTFDPGLVREAFRIWWHDTSARVMGSGEGGQTTEFLRGSSINELEHALLEPGDLAVTKDGRHVMAYLGDHVWIEADPGAKRVIKVRAPAPENHWFRTPITIVRWNVLQ